MTALAIVYWYDSAIDTTGFYIFIEVELEQNKRSFSDVMAYFKRKINDICNSSKYSFIVVVGTFLVSLGEQ